MSYKYIPKEYLDKLEPTENEFIILDLIDILFKFVLEFKKIGFSDLIE